METRPLLILLSLTLILGLLPIPTQSQNLILEIRKFDTYFRVPYVSVPTVSHNVYNISDGLEWEIILNQKVLFQSISFQFESKDLKFYYQPPLNEELDAKDYDFINATYAINEFEEIHRPLNVVGSYAVYHSSKRNNEYTTGKLFHIYRPFLIDAKLQTSWANLTINNNVMTITVDQNFLSTATYPVIIDPTFGKTDIGGTNGLLACDYAKSCMYTNDQGSGTAHTISIYTKVNSGTTAGDCALYDNSGGDPDNLLSAGSNFVITTTAQWLDSDINSAVSDTTVYHLAWNQDTLDARYYYDSGSSQEWNWKSMTFDSWDNPFGTPSGGDSRLYSIYCNFTTDEGQELSFDLFENILFHSSNLMLKELGFSHYENVRFHSSSLMLKEFGFLLFETVKFYGSSSLGRELGFLLGETIRFHSSIISSFEGVALDLTFILFETVSFVASRIADLSEVAVVVTELDVGSLAGLALIIAVIALSLVFVYKKQ